MLKIKAETIGFSNPTRVVCNNRVLETQGLDLETLCDLWKWYFNIPPYAEVQLLCNQRLYFTLRQHSLSSNKSWISLFLEQGIKVEVCDV